MAGNGNATNFGPAQSANNYTYDPIGNLTADNQAHVSNINWSVYGKIQSLTDSAGSINFSYNAAGQRTTKKVGVLNTYYVREMTGNTIAVYDDKANQINWREQDLFGSERIGMWLPNVNLVNNNASTVWDTIGKKNYQLTNHLNNILATITDARTAYSGYYISNVVAAQDYYAFGALMPGRAVSSTTYRYGFNGKENDNEIKGIGNQQDYGMRIYDGRVGRFLSVDPSSSQFPALSPYQFSSDSPISNTDLDGLEAKLAIAGSGGLQTEYSASGHQADIPSFAQRAKALKQFGFNTVSVHNGQMIINALKQATKAEGSISAIVSYAHGGSNAIFLDYNSGMYTSNTLPKSGHFPGNVSQIASNINKGDIKFEPNAIWIFASCNAGNSDDVILNQKVGSYNIARNIAGSLGIRTIGARGFVSPVVKNGIETGGLSAGPYNDVSYPNLGFVLFEPVKVTETVKVSKTFLGMRIPFTEKEVKITKTEVKETYIGTVINPINYVP